jgi:hypothetical protein
MKKLYAYKTKVGVFYIMEREGRFHPVFKEQSLGIYLTPQQAVDDLVGGRTISLPGGIDTTTLGIPPDLGDWERRVTS